MNTFSLHPALAAALGALLAAVSASAAASNLPPVAVADNPKTQQDTAKTIDVLANDSDPEGKPLTIVSVGTPDKGGKAKITDSGKVKYTPKANFLGKEKFTYTISDGKKQASATVTVTVKANCTPIVEPVNGTGGCRLAIVAPENCTSMAADYDYFDIEYTTSTTFCESPHHVYIIGNNSANPPIWNIQINETGGNWVALTGNGSGYSVVRNSGGILRLAKPDFDAIRQQLPSANGQYHFFIGGYYSLDNGGSISQSRSLLFKP